MDELAGENRFHMAQRFTAMINRYELSTLGDDGRSAGTPVAFAEQARFKLREKITFYRDETRENVLFELAQRQLVDLRGTFEIRGEGGAVLGVLRKRPGRSLLRTTWQLEPAAEDAPELLIQERSLLLAIVRRLIDFVPYVGGLIPILYSFELLAGTEHAGTVRRIPGLRDRYVLELEPGTTLDRRLPLALLVALDAFQGR